MPGDQGIRPLGSRPSQQAAKLDVAVASQVWVGRQALLVAFDLQDHALVNTCMWAVPQDGQDIAEYEVYFRRPELASAPVRLIARIQQLLCVPVGSVAPRGPSTMVPGMTQSHRHSSRPPQQPGLRALSWGPRSCFLTPKQGAPRDPSSLALAWQLTTFAACQELHDPEKPNKLVPTTCRHGLIPGKGAPGPQTRPASTQR